MTCKTSQQGSRQNKENCLRTLIQILSPKISRSKHRMFESENEIRHANASGTKFSDIGKSTLHQHADCLRNFVFQQKHDFVPVIGDVLFRLNHSSIDFLS